MAALRQIDGERQPDRPGADHHDRLFRQARARAILVGVAAIAELGPGLRHARNWLCKAAPFPLNSRNCNYLDHPRAPSLKLERFLAKSVFERQHARTRSGMGTGSREENASKKSSTLDLFRFCRSG